MRCDVDERRQKAAAALEHVAAADALPAFFSAPVGGKTACDTGDRVLACCAPRDPAEPGMTLDETLAALGDTPTSDEDSPRGRPGMCGEYADGSEWPFVRVQPAWKPGHFHVATFTDTKSATDSSRDGIPLALLGRTLREWVPDADFLQWEVGAYPPIGRNAHMVGFVDAIAAEYFTADGIAFHELTRAGQ